MMKNKVVIVTGSSSGIGEATAILFAKAGAKVIVNSHSNPIGGNKVVQSIRQFGGVAEHIQADLTVSYDVDRLFEKTLETFGTVDILINNAGKTIGMPFTSSTLEHWTEVFNYNFFSAVMCSKRAAEVMKKKGNGKILFTSSIRGSENGGREGIMAYSAAKAAINSFAKTLAKELAPNIQVNALAPGFVETPPYKNFSQEAKEGFVASTAIKRFIEPHEIAEGFLYLASSDAITGTILYIDGGFSLKFA